MSDLTRLIEAVTIGDTDLTLAMLEENNGLVNQFDESGATALHYATLHGRQQVVSLLLEKGAEINRADGRFGATPTGWAIEYLREKNGFLGIELSDLAYAIQSGDTRWVKRFLQRFPSLREGSDVKGTPFKQLARESGNQEIAMLFGCED